MTTLNASRLLAEVVAPEASRGKLGIFDARDVAKEAGVEAVALIAVGAEGQLWTFYTLTAEKARELGEALLKVAGGTAE